MNGIITILILFQHDNNSSGTALKLFTNLDQNKIMYRTF